MKEKNIHDELTKEIKIEKLNMSGLGVTET